MWVCIFKTRKKWVHLCKIELHLITNFLSPKKMTDFSVGDRIAYKVGTTVHNGVVFRHVIHTKKDADSSLEMWVLRDNTQQPISCEKGNTTKTLTDGGCTVDARHVDKICNLSDLRALPKTKQYAVVNKEGPQTCQDKGCSNSLVLEAGGGCRRMVLWPFCPKHMREKWKVEVQQSRISGLGLFSVEMIKKGSPVVPYSAHFPQEAAWKNMDKEQYAARVLAIQKKYSNTDYELGESEGRWHMSSEREDNYPGRFVNDSRCLGSTNVGIIDPESIMLEFDADDRRNRLSVDMVALRDIPKGEELTFDYGDSYWVDFLARTRLGYKSVETMLFEMRDYDFQNAKSYGEWLAEKLPTYTWTETEISTEWDTLKRYLYVDLRSQLASYLCLSREMTLGRFYSGLQKHLSPSCSLMELCDMYEIGFQFGPRFRSVLVQQCISNEMEHSLKMTSSMSGLCSS